MVIKPRLLLLFLGVWFQPHRGGDEPHWKPEQKLALHCANDYGKFLIFLIVLIVWMWPHLGVSVVFIFSCCPCQNYLWVRALQLFRVSKLKESFKNWIQVAFWNLFSSVDSHGSSLWICPWAFNQSPSLRPTSSNSCWSVPLEYEQAKVCAISLQKFSLFHLFPSAFLP